MSPALFYMHIFRVIAILDKDPAHVHFKNTFTADLTKRKEGTNVRFLKIAAELNPKFKNQKCLPKSERDEMWSLLSEFLKEQHSSVETTEPNHQKRKSTVCWWHLTQIMKMNMRRSALLWIIIKQNLSSAWMHVLWNGG